MQRAVAEGRCSMRAVAACGSRVWAVRCAPRIRSHSAARRCPSAYDRRAARAHEWRGAGVVRQPSVAPFACSAGRACAAILCRAHGGTRAGRNDEIGFNRGEPPEFERRNRRAGIVFHGHGLLLHGPVASMRASRRGGSTPRPAGRGAGIFLEIFCRCSKITPNQGVPLRA